MVLLVGAASAEDVFRPGRRVKPRTAIVVAVACETVVDGPSKFGNTYCQNDDPCTRTSPNAAPPTTAGFWVRLNNIMIC